MKHFPFIETGDFAGYYDNYEIIDTTSGILEGSMKQPSNIFKLQTNETLIINDVILEYVVLTEYILSDWFQSYIKYINLTNYLSPSQYDILYNVFLNSSFVDDLSYPSIAYLTKNDGQSNDYPYDDLFITNEYTLGVNTYLNNFIKEYALSLPHNDILRDIILTNHIDNAYISNICKLTYNNQTEYVYAFDGILYDKYIANGSLADGGGNRFGEIKFAGDKIQAHYKVRKNISKDDPTIGMCSGEGKPFCMGDQIYIIDTTCYTYNNTSWSWVGDFTTIDRVMYVSDVSNACFDYRNVPVVDMLFPFRIIQFCKFDNFY